MLNNFESVVLLARNSEIGKHLPYNLYIHSSALRYLDSLIQQYEIFARQIADNVDNFTLIKFSLDEPKVSYLFYPEFDHNPHPYLTKSVLVNLRENNIKIMDYSNSNNPPILHRKETFITPDYPYYEQFKYLTTTEENLGLLDNPRYIGTREKWQQLLLDNYVSFHGHNLVCLLSNNPHESIEIKRHRAAMARYKLSRPVRLVLEAGLFSPEYTFFDYGCGYGVDVKVMAEKGYQSDGWDPYYQPNNTLKKADVVNLGYIINVIENLTERREALVKAWLLTQEILIVSAQVLICDRTEGYIPYGDGLITERNTFQKYYEQEELKNYIQQVLNEEAIPIGLGVFLVFKNSEKANSFRLSRFHSQVRSPRILTPVKKFADYQELLTPVINFYSERGRLPRKGELRQEEEIKGEFRSYRQAFKVILQVTDEGEWDKIADQRRQDILLYLALSHFDKRPTFKQLSPLLKNDIKDLFGSYNVACFLADEMLISLGNLEFIKSICSELKIGKLFEKSFLIHLKNLDKLPTRLRLYEGCASRTIGRMESATLIRFHFDIPRITYLSVPDFETEKEPTLDHTMSIDLQDLRVRYRNYKKESNPPRIIDKHLLLSLEENDPKI